MFKIIGSVSFFSMFGKQEYGTSVSYSVSFCSIFGKQEYGSSIGKQVLLLLCSTTLLQRKQHHVNWSRDYCYVGRLKRTCSSARLLWQG